MSIASRINEIGVHLTKDWRSIEALTGEAEVDKNIENIASVLDNLWEEMPKVTGAGESLTLNTKKGKMKLNLSGNTSQTGTPTPSSPIPVNVVSGDNTIVSTGINLLNKSAASGSSVEEISNGIKLTNAWASNIFSNAEVLKMFKPNTKYTCRAVVRVTAKPSSQTERQDNKLALYRGASGGLPSTFIGVLQVPNSIDIPLNTDTPIVSYSFTTPADLTNLQIIGYCFRDSSGATGTLELKELMIVEGNYNSSNYPSYEPYQSTSYPIHLGEHWLGWIGNYKDRFFKNIPNTTDYKSDLEDNEWYLEKKIGKVVLDGSESWSIRSGTNYTTKIYDKLPVSTSVSTNFEGYCDYYQTNVNWDALTNLRAMVYKNSAWNYANVQISDNTFNSTDALKTWLSTHNTSVYYQLATPTYTQITGALKDELESAWRANSYKGQTNISQVNNDLAFELDVEGLSA